MLNKNKEWVRDKKEIEGCGWMENGGRNKCASFFSFILNYDD